MIPPNRSEQFHQRTKIIDVLDRIIQKQRPQRVQLRARYTDKRNANPAARRWPLENTNCGLRPSPTLRLRNRLTSPRILYSIVRQSLEPCEYPKPIRFPFARPRGEGNGHREGQASCHARLKSRARLQLRQPAPSCPDRAELRQLWHRLRRSSTTTMRAFSTLM